MANKEKIDYLLLDIQKLETLVASMRDAEMYPVSFFDQTFNLTHKILKDLHALEAIQIESLRKQMEEHQNLLQSLPSTAAVPIQMGQGPNQIAPESSQPTQATTPTEIKEEVNEPIIKEEISVKESFTEPVPEPTETVNNGIQAERSGLFHNDLLEKRNLSDFRKAFSLNDRFRFRRELFGGDEARMSKAINELNELQSYEDSITYLNKELKWNIEDETVADFIKLLEKRFL